MDTHYGLAKYHTKPYPSISPTRPELSNAGRTILILGASTGIGHSIARAFCAASASTVILVSRRQDILSTTVASLQKSYPDTKIVGKACDVFSIHDSERLWKDFEAENARVDVLVFNAVHYPAIKPVMEQGTARIWEDFEANVKMPIWWCETLYKQPGHTGKKVNIYLTTKDIVRLDDTPNMPDYQLTKCATTCAMGQIARDIPADKLQIISMHPGVILTEAARGAGYDENTLPWNDENLPGHFAVWASSPLASFLNGRYVWSNWDVDDLSSGKARKTIDADPWYLKVGVKGL